MIRNVTGYQWYTIEEFNTDRESLDDLFGYPRPGDETLTSMVYLENLDLNGDVEFYYVGHNSQFVPVLGDPIQFDINEFLE